MNEYRDSAPITGEYGGVREGGVEAGGGEAKVCGKCFVGFGEKGKRARNLPPLWFLNPRPLQWFSSWTAH